jgi:GNAT superfamily N-acetyltransferase
MIVTLPFASETSLIRAAADHPEITLARMTTEDATIIGTGLAEIDPWTRLDFAGERFANFLAADGDGAFRFKILFGAERAGAVVVRFPWLSGPYLNILGILPAFQRRGVGALALTWLENESRRLRPEASGSACRHSMSVPEHSTSAMAIASPPSSMTSSMTARTRC